MRQGKGLGKLLREYRVKASLTQMDVASLLGYSTSQFVSNWERGVSLPALDKTVKLCKLLKVDPSVIIDGMLSHKADRMKRKLKSIA